MEYTKELIQLLCQECINEYSGKYGSVKEQIPNIYRFNVDKVEGHFGWHDQELLYIVFRGSSSLRDWISNLQFWHEDVKKSKPYGNLNSDVEVHTGFINQYKLVRCIIIKKIEEFKPKKIIVTGHSLGGALSTLCAVDIQYNFSDIDISCVTFGSPRVGNKYFVNSFNKRIPNSLRFVNCDDIVTKVPMDIMGYEHVSMKKQIGKTKWYHCLGSTNDHYPENYYKNI